MMFRCQNKGSKGLRGPAIIPLVLTLEWNKTRQTIHGLRHQRSSYQNSILLTRVIRNTRMIRGKMTNELLKNELLLRTFYLQNFKLQTISKIFIVLQAI